MDGWWDRTDIPTRLGAAVVGATRLGGGDVSEAFALDLTDGRRVFAKTHADPPEGFFTTEAAGLSWLGETDALPVPAVLAVTDAAPAHLVLEWIEPGARAAADEAAFGRGLADLHRAGATAYGRADGRTTGSLALPNDPCDTWVSFMADRRLRPLARIGRDRRALPADLAAGLEALADRLADLGIPEEGPARLHGDLWAGNRMVGADGRSWLIDPAAHGGHREHDLAMMDLFGGFGEACWAAYDTVHPLAPGWRDRVALHQVVPLAVHAIKFGGGYVDAARRAVARYG